jgi:hypothetical protein
VTVRSLTCLATAVVVMAVVLNGFWGVLWAAAGLLVTLAVVRIGLLVGAYLAGSRVHGVVVGVGPRVMEWRNVVLRAFPVVLKVDFERRGMAVAAWVSGGAGVVVVAGSAFVSWSAALGGVVALVHSAWAGRAVLDRPETDPCVLQVFDLVQAGELDAAERLVGQLSVANPGQRTVRASRVLVLEARGRYAEALMLAIGMSSDAEQQDAAAAMATVAGLTGAAVEAGQLTAEDGLPVAACALYEAIELGKPSYKLHGVRALIALQAGEPQLAVQLARLACKHNGGSLGRADNLATLARAYMAAGDNSAARRTLAKAERLVPWWPRVALTRSRLDLA